MSIILEVSGWILVILGFFLGLVSSDFSYFGIDRSDPEGGPDLAGAHRRIRIFGIAALVAGVILIASAA